MLEVKGGLCEWRVGAQGKGGGGVRGLSLEMWRKKIEPVTEIFLATGIRHQMGQCRGQFIN